MHQKDARRFVIDRSPPEQLTDSELRAWAGDQTVFVSSVMQDMRAEREAAVSGIERVGAVPLLFERLGGRDDAAQTAYRDGVRGADIYVGILGERYGVPDAGGYSPTHAEYDEAVHHGLRISVWATTGDMDGRQRDFLNEVRVFHTTGSYRSPDELATGIERRLRELAANASSPWCKVGSAMFRASRYLDAGDRLTVEATVRDPEVLAELERLRPTRWGRAEAVRATCAGRTNQVQVESVTVEATAGRGRRVRLDATPDREGGHSTLHDVSFEGRSPDDLTELAVRVALLGEENPLGTMSFFADMANPLTCLAGLELTEDAIPAIADVLLTEALVGSGRAERITALRIGPLRRGTRPLLLQWAARRRFTNAEPERRAVAGELRF